MVASDNSLYAIHTAKERHAFEQKTNIVKLSERNLKEIGLVSKKFKGNIYNVH